MPESKKDKEYHRKWGLHIAHSCINKHYDVIYGTIDNAYEFYNGTDVSDELPFLQTSESGAALNAKWMNLNKIKHKVDVLTGEFLRKGYEINVRANDKTSVSNRLRKKKMSFVDMKLEPVKKALESENGIPLPRPEKVPRNVDELEQYYDKEYKEISEIVISRMLKYVDKMSNHPLTRYECYRDLIIAGQCFVKNRLINGYVTQDRVDPRNMIWDKNATDDLLSDASYFGEVRYMNIADCAREYGVEQNAINEIYELQSARNIDGRHAAFKKAYPYYGDIFGDSSLSPFRNDDTGLRVLVVETYWAETLPMNYKMSADKFGNVHIKKSRRKHRSKEVSPTVKVWRKCVLIGGVIIPDNHWGLFDNMDRSVDDISNTGNPYQCLIPNYINGRAVSKVMQMEALQKLKDICWYNLQLQMNTAGGRAFVYDVSQCPDGWEVEEVLHYLKTAHIAFIESARDGLPTAHFNQFQQIDLSMSQTVNQYLEISRAIDMEMDAITGVNEARQGQSMGASQAVGVTNAMLHQSTTSTEHLTFLFDVWQSRCYTQQANIMKTIWAYEPERFSPIIGEVGMDFLKEDIDLDLHDYGIVIDSTPNQFQDQQIFQQAILNAISSNQLNEVFLKVLQLLMTKDVKEAMLELEQIVKKQEQKAVAMQQQEQQAQAQLQQSQIQAEMEKDERNNQWEETLTALGIQGDIQKELIKGRIALAKERMKV